jgi:hypothetical protein
MKLFDFHSLRFDNEIRDVATCNSVKTHATNLRGLKIKIAPKNGL